jgi:hypothetical protein
MSVILLVKLKEIKDFIFQAVNYNGALIIVRKITVCFISACSLSKKYFAEINSILGK